MATDLESLTIGGLNLNDETTWMLRRLVNNPPARRAEWLDSPDADGGILTRIPTLERMTIEAEIELVADVSMEAALDSLLELIEILDESERLIPGQTVTRTPAETDRTRITYCQLGEITNLPIEQTGDLQGWLQARPVVILRLECVPYWLGTLTTGASVTNSDPIQTVNVTPEGNLPAFGIVRYTDAATQDRSHVEIGADHTSDLTRSYLIDSASLVTSGTSGTATTRTGAYSSNGVIRATLTTSPAVVCKTAALTHIGDFKVKPRVYGAGSGEISVRIDYRQGDAPYTEGVWKTVPGRDAFYELDGPWLLAIEEATSGTQSAEVRVVAKSTVPGDTLDVDYLIPLPLSAFYGVARAPSSSTVADVFSAADSFSQVAGSLSGKTATIGGNWTTAGSATDFVIDAVNGRAQRTTAASETDARYAVLGSAATVQAATADIVASAYPAGLWQGLVLRYVDANNWLAVVRYSNSSIDNRLDVIQRVAGVQTILLEETLPTIAVGGFHTISASVNLAGAVTAAFDSATYSTYCAAAIVGGVLASGKSGLIDYNPSATASTRQWENYAAWSAPDERVLYAGRSIELQRDEVLREASAGGVWGRPPIYRGGFAILPPGLTTRVVAKARRNDVAELPDSSIADSGTLSVDYIPRYSVPM